MNGVSCADFSLDMGFTLKKIIQLENTALDDFAACSGLSQTQLNELVSWTGKRIGDVRTIFRDEVFVSRALRNPVIRGCPICLREDIGTDCASPLTQMTMRGDWQLREVSLCVTHHHPLMPLWEHSRPSDRYDLSSRFTEVLEDVVQDRLVRPHVPPSQYDYWLDTRLKTGADDTWLAGHSLYAATTFCKLLGTELQRIDARPDMDVGAQRRRAQTMGFNVASLGKVAIREALNALVIHADGCGDRPNKAFGQLYVDLARAHLSNADFAPFRQIVRDCIVDVWPIASGETVLGIIQPERKLHSVASAARKANISPHLVEEILINAGATSVDDNRPRPRKTFDAKAYADLLEEIPTLVSLLEMRRVMGATKHQMISLINDGLLTPRIDIPSPIASWSASDGIAFVAELQELAIAITPDDQQWEGLQQAKVRSGMRLGTIIDALRDGSLQLGRRTNHEGYGGFCVRKEGVDQMELQNQQPAHRNLVSGSVFARSIGIRTQGWFAALSTAGHTTATRIQDPKWDGERVYASPRDIVEFNKVFFTSATMETEFGQHRRTLIAKLNAAGVKPFSPNGEDYGPLYLREEVEAVLGDHRPV